MKWLLKKLNMYFARDNKGFSLVELIISFAILGFVMIAIVGFMATSMRFYGNTTSIVGLQYEYQAVMTHIKEHIIDCNEGTVFNGTENALYIVEKGEVTGGGEGFITHVFFFDDAAGIMSYGVTESAAGAAMPAVVDLLTIERAELSSRMTDFDVLINTVTIDGNERVVSLGVFMGFQVRTRTYESTQDISVRNRILTTGSAATTYNELRNILDTTP